MKTKKNLIVIALVVAIGLSGVTYAFFDYYKLGANQKITAGSVNLTLNEGEDTINRSNIFPETVEKARSRTDNFITFTVSGINTTEDEDIWYEIMLNEGDPETGMTRFDANDLVFDLVELDDKGKEVTYLVDAMSYNDFNARRIWVNTVDRNTSLIVDKTYKLRMWLSEDVKISDTNPFADYKSTGYENHYASIKVSVYGDFVEKSTPYNYFAKLGTSSMTFWPSSINAKRANITEVNFIQMPQSEIDAKMNDETITIKEDVTDTTKGGSVSAWLENGDLITNEDGTQTQYYIMYVASDGTTYFPNNSGLMFMMFQNLKEINFDNIDTSNVTSMQSMFFYCSSLKELDLSTFDTSNVTTMLQMFVKCLSLTELDVSNFDTSNVNNMRYIFQYCSNLKEIDVRGFDTSNVTDMGGMFQYCSSLTELDVSNFDTNNVNNMTTMFGGCSNLTKLDVSSFDMSNVTKITSMFNLCSSLQSLDVSNWDTSQVTTMQGVFADCSSLKSLDVSNWNTSQVTTMHAMFNNCTSLESLDINKWDTSQVTSMYGLFNNCKSLKSLDISAWDMSNVTDINNDYAMFQLVSKATEIKIPNNVKVIGDFMFNQNSAHIGDTFTIPDGVTEIGKSYVWYGYGKTFNEFIVEDGNTNFKTIDGILYTMDGTRLVSVPTYKTFVDRTFIIPAGVTFIGEASFSKNKNVDTLVLPDSYVIKRYVSEFDSAYNSVNVNEGNSLSIGINYQTSISKYVVNDDNPNYTSVDGCIYSKDGSELIAVPWQYNGALNIKEGTTTIGQEAFWAQGSSETSATTKLTSVHIPASVTTIEGAQITALNGLVGRITITIDETNPNYTVSDGKIVEK